MAKDINIAINAKDNFTAPLKKMQSSQTAFRENLVNLNNKLKEVNNMKINPKVNLTQAKNEVEKTEVAFKKLEDAITKTNAKMTQTKSDAVKHKFDSVSKGAKQAEKDINKLADTMSKVDKKASKSKMASKAKTGSNSEESNGNDTSGFRDMLVEAGTQALGTGLTSALGKNVGGAVSSVAKRTIEGAIMGSAVPVIGTAIGAGIGAITGVIEGATQIFQAKDDAFKEVVKSNYNLSKATQAKSLKSGSNIASNKEQMKREFSNLLGKDSLGKEFVDKAEDFSAKTPFKFEEVTDIAKEMLNNGTKSQEILPLLKKVAGTGLELNMSSKDMKIVATTLGGMNTNKKASSEDLKALLDSNIPVWDYLAQAKSKEGEKPKTAQEVKAMVSRGEISEKEVAEGIANTMSKKHSDGIGKQNQTYEGLSNQRDELQAQIDGAMGDGYNEERKKGLQAQVDYLQGESGTKMKEANKIIGKWKASLDNEHDKSIRTAMDEKMKTEFDDAISNSDGAKLEQLMSQAQIQGENAYLATDGYQEQLKSNTELIQKIREDTRLKDDYYMTGYIMGEEFSKGIVSGKLGSAKSAGYTASGGNSFYGPSCLRNTSRDNKIPSTTPNATPNIVSPYNPIASTVTKAAFGHARIPYDDYPALLHEGERVLTASEARSYNKPSSIQVVMNGTVIREDADINKVASAFLGELQKASVNTALGVS